MVEVRELRKISDRCPAQWEGLTGQHGSVYIRYRRGNLEVSVSIDNSDASSVPSLVDLQVGDKYDGEMETERMKALLTHRLRFLD